MEGELRDDQWELLAPLLPRPNFGAALGLTTAAPSTASCGYCAPAPGGETFPRNLVVPQPATGASRSGKNRESGSISGSPFSAPWINKASYTGARLFWMGALYPQKRGRGHCLWLEGQGQH